MVDTLTARVARALQRARAARERGTESAPEPGAGENVGEQAPNADEIAWAGAAIEACFDDIWSSGYLIGSKYGSSDVSATLLRSAAKEQILGRAPRSEGTELPAVGRPPDNALSRAEAMLRQLLEQSKSRRS